MSFPSYPKYKESGVEWLGQVPEHWDTSKLRYICHCLDGQRIPLNAAQRSDKQGDIPYWGANSIVGYVDEALFEEDLVLLGEDGAPFFEPSKPVAFFIQGKVWPNNHVHVLRPLLPNTGKFITHVLNATDYAQFIDGSTRDKLTQGSMNDIPVPWPPLPEQTAIAAFLDRETVKIDALVAEQQRLIELLKEKRQAVISHAVTKGLPAEAAAKAGLNPNAPMKPSGIEWLGDVPAHWTPPRKLKEISSLKGRLGWQGLKADEYKEEGPYVVSSAHFQDFRIDWSICPHVTNERYEIDDNIQLSEGDILLMKDGAALGKLAFVDSLPDRACLNSHLLLFRPLRKCQEATYISQFMFLFMRTTHFQEYIKVNATGTTFLGISQESIGNCRVALPPISEQIEIVSFLKTEISKLDTLTAEAQRAIDLLQERRTALISAAVTGQIEVCNQGGNMSK